MGVLEAQRAMGNCVARGAGAGGCGGDAALGSSSPYGYALLLLLRPLVLLLLAAGNGGGAQSPAKVP